MSFTILLLSADADADPSWPDKIREAVPGAIAKIYADPKDALADIETADAAFGTVPPELFARAKRLRWICASRAGLGGAYFHDALVKSDVVVTGSTVATTSISRPMRWRSFWPLPAASTTTYRRSAGSVGRG